MTSTVIYKMIQAQSGVNQIALDECDDIELSLSELEQVSGGFFFWGVVGLTLFGSTLVNGIVSQAMTGTAQWGGAGSYSGGHYSRRGG